MPYAPSVPLPRVIFPALVGTTTASRNALRLASPAARMPPRPRGRRRRCSPLPPRAMYSQYTHARTHARTLTRAHTWPFAPARARVCVQDEPHGGEPFRSRPRTENGLVRAHSARKHAATRRRPLSQARNATGDDPTITRRSRFRADRDCAPSRIFQSGLY